MDPKEMDPKEMEKLLRKYEKKFNRLDRIIKQSDKQQLQMYKLYNTIEEQKKEIERLYKYTIDQQLIAKSKLESLIVNDFEDQTDIIFKASDVLSGDYYSIFKLKNGDALIYLLDGQGHGVSPALTIFATATNMLQILNKDEAISFEYIVRSLFSEVKKFLSNSEQISYFLIHVPADMKNINYVGGGMYPFYVRMHNDEIIKFKANNLPFLSFSDIPTIGKHPLDDRLKNLVLYTDGIVEEPDIDVSKYHPKKIVANPSLIESLKEVVAKSSFNDDVTLIHFYDKN
ncbi:MAG: SpoIIE family protein phosphatase [Epsilonproteobacteria bacterium]|nr:SpoIIE family protein phosphatase [Campylobacterota bacterium]